MAVLTWDQSGERYYETGVDRGVLYVPTNGVYNTGVAWNGLTAVTESPTGAEPTPMYADNIKYLNLLSVEEFGGTIEAMTYPDEFAECDGTASPEVGVFIAQQTRSLFGLSYRSRLGNDVSATDFGYKLHLVYGALASPSERAYNTINDTPEAITFSWTFTTTPIPVTGYKNTALVTIDSSLVPSSNLAAIEAALYGTSNTSARLPLPDEIIAMVDGAQTVVTATDPTFVASTGVITIPTVTGVTYRRTDTNAIVTNTVTISPAGASLTISASPSSGAYKLSASSNDDWTFTRNP
jgi:hypothetical protein